MAPITSVSTRKGRFQVWSDPNVDDPATSIPIHVEVGPHEGRLGFAAPGAEAHTTAWLFLPDGRNVADLTLELSLVDRAIETPAHRSNVMRPPLPAACAPSAARSSG